MIVINSFLNFLNLFSVISIFNSLIAILLGTVLYLNNRKNRLHQIWLLFTLCYTFWSFSLGIMAGSPDKDYSLFWGKMLFAGAIFIPITHFHFLFIFLNKEQKYKRLLKIGYLASVFFFFSNFTKYFVLETRPILSFAYWTKAGILMYPFMLMFIGIVILAILELIKSYQREVGLYRSQIKYLLMATTIGYAGGITNFLPTFNIAIYPYGNFIAPLSIILIAYAVFKYRLMDIDVVYRKGAIYFAGLLFIL